MVFVALDEHVPRLRDARAHRAAPEAGALPLLAAKAELLGDTRDAEGLAGEAGAENVELGDVGHGHRVDVAMRGLAEIGGVSLLGVLVPIGGEDAPAARALEGEAEPANAAEEVNERRTGVPPVSICFGRRVWGLNGDRRDALSYTVGRRVFLECSSRRESVLLFPGARSLSGLTSAATGS